MRIFLSFSWPTRPWLLLYRRAECLPITRCCSLGSKMEEKKTVSPFSNKMERIEEHTQCWPLDLHTHTLTHMHTCNHMCTHKDKHAHHLCTQKINKSLHFHLLFPSSLPFTVPVQITILPGTDPTYTWHFMVLFSVWRKGQYNWYPALSLWGTVPTQADRIMHFPKWGN